MRRVGTSPLQQETCMSTHTAEGKEHFPHETNGIEDKLDALLTRVETLEDELEAKDCRKVRY